MTEEQVAQMRATYCGLMSEIDDHLGRVFDYLKETGQWDDTLIVFTCDHGEQAGDHHLLGKIGYFDESYRIPMIIRDPRAGGQRHARHDRRKLHRDDRHHADHPRMDGPAGCRASATAVRCCRFCEGATPADWRTEVHYEFDFRDLYYSKPESALRRADGQVLARRRAGRELQVRALRRPAAAALRPEEGPRPVRQPRRRSGLCRDEIADYAHKMLNWRLGFAERTLDRLSRHAKGLEVRAARCAGWPEGAR